MKKTGLSTIGYWITTISQILDWEVADLITKFDIDRLDGAYNKYSRPTYADDIALIEAQRMTYRDFFITFVSVALNLIWKH